MSDMIIIQGEIDENGHLIVELPDDAPKGQVKVTIQFETIQVEGTEDDIEAYLASILELESTNESLKGMGLTMGEIAQSPQIGILEDENLPDSLTYVEEIRGKRRYQW